MSTASRLLPIFPLPQVVLMPGAVLPLHIFEERYKQLVKDVVEEDYLFGLTLYHQPTMGKVRGFYSTIGTMAKIIDYETLPNGRMNIVVQGMDRFKIIQPESQIKPYLQGFIQLFSDHVNEPIDAVLVHQVKTHYQEIIRLNHALENQDFDGHIDLPDDPTALSFYIGDLIQGDAPFKQTLLESQSLSFRLNQELKYLESAIQRLAIYNQIEDIFRNSKAR